MFRIYQGQLLQMRSGYDFDGKAEVECRCIRESSPHFGKWCVRIEGNFSGWLTESEIRDEFDEREP